jgi:O-antigen/teichoic acid export membrane protein
VLLLTVAAVAWMPQLFGSRLGADLRDVQWVVLLLGATVAVHIGLQVYRGVLTGCHRWDVHNQIDALFQGVATAGMIAALAAGGRLPALAAVIFVSQSSAEIARLVFSYRLCPGLELRRRYANLGDAKQMLLFGGKLSIGAVAEIILFQTNSLLILSHSGTAALALYSRPMAILRTVTTFGRKFSLVLVPTVGSMHSRGQHDELRRLLCDASAYAAMTTLPILTGLIILGDAVLEVWMGPHYQLGPVLTILAFGAVLPMTQQPAASILIGMNRHGVLAATALIAAVCGTILAILLIDGFNLGLTGAAIAVAGAMSGGGLVIPFAACKAVELPVSTYLREVYSRPLAAMVPFTAALTAALYASPVALSQLMVGVALGAAVLAATYWYWVFPPQLRQRIVQKFQARLGRYASST